ncbi:MAG: hypothetical protein NT027_08700 [Proteobacteria bacterium]|nr:hypothetical protein [Pseudomonadota bacterium]
MKKLTSLKFAKLLRTSFSSISLVAILVFAVYCGRKSSDDDVASTSGKFIPSSWNGLTDLSSKLWEITKP